MSTPSVDIVSGDFQVAFYVSDTTDGSKITTGTVALRVFELQTDETLKQLDFDDDTFKTSGLTTPTLNLTHQAVDSHNTGVWTGEVTATNFTAGRIYFLQITPTATNTIPQTQKVVFENGGPLVRLGDFTHEGKLNLSRITVTADAANPAVLIDATASGSRGFSITSNDEPAFYITSTNDKCFQIIGNSSDKAVQIQGGAGQVAYSVVGVQANAVEYSSTISGTAFVLSGVTADFSGTIPNVTLVDTVTTNTDMRGTDGAVTSLGTLEADVAAILVDTGTTIPALISGISGGTTNNYYSSVQVVPDGGVRNTDPITFQCFQNEPKSFSVTVNDADVNAVDLSGKTLRFVVQDENNPTTAIFDVESGGITISGDNNEVATIAVTAGNTATAANYLWRLWEVDTAVLAHGPFQIIPAADDGP